jgi:hypothetical protein
MCPTQLVILELITQIENRGFSRCVWIDNLFILELLLLELRNHGISGAGIVRTGKTKVEEAFEKEGTRGCETTLISP